jgi:hypothetical protein
MLYKVTDQDITLQIRRQILTKQGNVVHQVIVAYLYYCRAIGNTLMPSLSSIPTEQSIIINNIEQKVMQATALSGNISGRQYLHLYR